MRPWVRRYFSQNTPLSSSSLCAVRRPKLLRSTRKCGGLLVSLSLPSMLANPDVGPVKTSL